MRLASKSTINEKNIPPYLKKLGVYITDPAKYPDKVVFNDTKVVIINDLFPKSKVHLLIIPKDRSKTFLHPLEAFQDKEFLKLVRDKYVPIGKKLAMDQLIQQTGIEDPKFLNERFKVGVHAVPSMAHLHIHIISTDFVSPSTKNRVHYNTFNTGFFILLNEIPLDQKKYHERADPNNAKQKVKQTELKCLHCDKNFGNKFTQLKSHLLLEDKKIVQRFNKKVS